MQLNYTNFFRWYTGAPLDDTINIPRIGKTDGCRHSYPLILPGEEVGMFINAVLPFLDNDSTANLHLRIIGGPDLGAILSKSVDGLGYRLFASFALPSMAAGIYRLEVYNTATSTQKCISNDFRVLASAGDTSLIRYRHSRSIYNFDYEQFPDFYNSVRVRVSLGAYTGESNIDTLQNVASGRRRLLNGNSDKSLPLSTYYFDDGMHDAMIALVEHDYIEINGRSYIKKSGYNPNARQQSGVSVGQLEVYEQAFSTVNKSGQVPVQRRSGKVIAPGRTVEVYSANNVKLATKTDLVFDGDVPYGGSVKVLGTGNATVAFLNGNNGLTYSINPLPVTVLQKDLYGVDYVVS